MKLTTHSSLALANLLSMSLSLVSMAPKIGEAATKECARLAEQAVQKTAARSLRAQPKVQTYAKTGRRANRSLQRVAPMPQVEQPSLVSARKTLSPFSPAIPGQLSPTQSQMLEMLKQGQLSPTQSQILEMLKQERHSLLMNYKEGVANVYTDLLEYQMQGLPVDTKMLKNYRNFLQRVFSSVVKEEKAFPKQLNLLEQEIQNLRLKNDRLITLRKSLAQARENAVTLQKQVAETRAKLVTERLEKASTERLEALASEQSAYENELQNKKSLVKKILAGILALEGIILYAEGQTPVEFEGTVPEIIQHAK